jgi:hypothetical protein
MKIMYNLIIKFIFISPRLKANLPKGRGAKLEGLRDAPHHMPASCRSGTLLKWVRTSERTFFYVRIPQSFYAITNGRTTGNACVPRDENEGEISHAENLQVVGFSLGHRIRNSALYGVCGRDAI